jgi:hypothetical protein
MATITVEEEMDYSGYTFDRLKAEKSGLIAGNREFRQTLRELDPSDREERDNMYRSIEHNDRLIAEIEAELDRRSRH